MLGYFLNSNRKDPYKNIFEKETINDFPTDSNIEFETLFEILQLGSNSQNSSSLKNLHKCHHQFPTEI